MPEKRTNELYSEDETARRRDAVIRRMVNTPPKPHSEMKLGKRKAKAKSIQAAKRSTESK